MSDFELTKQSRFLIGAGLLIAIGMSLAYPKILSYVIASGLAIIVIVVVGNVAKPPWLTVPAGAGLRGDLSANRSISWTKVLGFIMSALPILLNLLLSIGVLEAPPGFDPDTAFVALNIAIEALIDALTNLWTAVMGFFVLRFRGRRDKS